MIAASSRAALTLALGPLGLLSAAPASFDPPLLYAVEADPFIIPADTYGAWIARYTVVAVVAASPDNDIMTAALDTLLDRALTALDDEGWDSTAGPYESLNGADGQTYLACRVTAQTNLRPL